MFSLFTHPVLLSHPQFVGVLFLTEASTWGMNDKNKIIAPTALNALRPATVRKIQLLLILGLSTGRAPRVERKALQT